MGKRERIKIHEYLAEFDDIPGTRVFTGGTCNSLEPAE